MKFHRWMNLTALLVTIFGSRSKYKHSDFWYLTSQRYLLYKFRLKKDKLWVLSSKFCCRTILMHFLLIICGKFTRAQPAHQIFLYKFFFNVHISYVESKKVKTWVWLSNFHHRTLFSVTILGSRNIKTNSEFWNLIH
jgi:hypothetical protein